MTMVPIVVPVVVSATAAGRNGGSSGSSIGGSSSSVVGRRVIAFSHGEKHTRARDSLLSRHRGLYTRCRAHTEGEPGENEPPGRACTIYISLSRSFSRLPPSPACLSSILLLYRVSRSPLRRLRSSLYLARSLTLVQQFNLPSSGRTPANSRRRCQARFHPPAHKGEPKRVGQ